MFSLQCSGLSVPPSRPERVEGRSNFPFLLKQLTSCFKTCLAPGPRYGEGPGGGIGRQIFSSGLARSRFVVSLRFEDLRSLESEPEVSLQFSTIAFKLLTQLRSALKKDQPSYIYIYIYLGGLNPLTTIVQWGVKAPTRCVLSICSGLSDNIYIYIYIHY